MSQVGFTPISIYYSATATNVPTAGNLVAGELALNTADGKLFYKDSSNVVQVIGTKGGVGTSSTTQVLYNSSGLVVGSANLTFNGTTLTTANDASISGLTVGKGGGAVSSNTAVGLTALNASASGTNNSGFGSTALYSLANGSNNTGLGSQALYSNTSGSSSTGVGQAALYGNTTGSANTAIGFQSLVSNTTASNNTAVGYQAGYSNTTGGAGSGYNTFIGMQAGYLATGYNNTFIGQGTGYSTTGNNNTFIGMNNAGYSSGSLVTTGSNNTILGGYNGNQGGLDIRTASNYIVLSDGTGNPRAYNNATNWYQGNNSTLWAITSDARIKKNVVSLESGLNVISALRPVEFDYIANDKHDIGFIAQEYQTVLPEQVNEKDDGMLSLNQNLVPYLVKAIQELKAEIDSLKQQLGK